MGYFKTKEEIHCKELEKMFNTLIRLNVPANINCNDYIVKGYLIDKEKEIYAVTVRNGGEALRYLMDKHNDFLSVSYTTHYFKKGEKEWNKIFNSPLKEKLKFIYGALPYQEENNKALQNFFSFKEELESHYPKNQEGKSAFWCSNFERYLDNPAKCRFCIHNDNFEYITIHLNELGNVIEMDYHNNQGRPFVMTQMKKKGLEEVTKYIKDAKLLQIATNCEILLNEEKIYVSYTDRNTNIENTMSFITEREAEEFIENLPKTRYDSCILQTEQNEIEYSMD